MAKIKAVESLTELQYLCNNGDKQEKYKKLLELASENLGCPSGYDHLQWLRVSASEVGEEDVVEEINFCMDMV